MTQKLEGTYRHADVSRDRQAYRHACIHADKEADRGMPANEHMY